MDSDSESNLVSLFSQLFHLIDNDDSDSESKFISQIIEIISFVRSMDFDSQPKPESRLMSLVSQAVSLFNSMDLDSLPEPLSKLISLISHKISIDSDQKLESDLEFESLSQETLELDPVPELISLIRQIVSVARSMNSKVKKLTSLCPQVRVSLEEGEIRVIGEVRGSIENTGNCFLGKWEEFTLTGDDATHFWCRGCNGEYHEEYEKAPLKIKHPLHPKHSLLLVLNEGYDTRECYCCDEDLEEIFYCCSACNYAMNIACVEKAPDLSIPPTKWHEHTLSLFPRKASLTCDVCALSDSSSPLYMCPPCDFVVHLTCISLPRLIRISRHPHRICYTPSFDQGNVSCGVCRRKIDRVYGGFSCIKDCCSYAVHSRCATQSNVWDGIDLEGEPEEIEEEDAEPPFVRIGDGVIQHFSHEHHYLRLDENTDRDYDDNVQCQACITPIYFGNLYSCVQCEFVLHETCANLSRKIYHPIHPHLLTLALMGGNDDAMDHGNRGSTCYECSACRMFLTAGFFYECGKEECDFKLHVQCATISEPLVHQSHKHPLFLTSKPGEMRRCSVCTSYQKETFNCVECDGFALCVECATLPQKVRYKHDKHILTLSYGEETITTTDWCEACEGEINPKKGFYMCDEYCCVTLHIECLIGRDLYMKPGSSFSIFGVLSNNLHMSRPICSFCEKRCPHKIVFQRSGSIFCSIYCLSELLLKYFNY